MGTVLNQLFDFSSSTTFHESQQHRLRDAIQSLDGDPPSSIPFLVWLLENPASPIALPGKIDLYRHDCLHVLLNRGFSLYDEAFVIGFSMGNDTKTRWIHLVIFKVLAASIYPNQYRFNQSHLKIFNLGVDYGRAIRIKNLNRFNFSNYQEQPLSSLRAYFGITDIALQTLRQKENMYLSI